MGVTEAFWRYTVAWRAGARKVDEVDALRETAGALVEARRTGVGVTKAETILE